ncbi:ABC transporter ATP-binding protein [Streptomyces longwoodensis]|uniref:ABC transporter ATP-binding protein n=1 Tax=Streptomyces longwoodensis TaxID=68231 RepID=UPI00225A28A4|nr:ABC transporter ATP-binding protein [Streptomyces longwoodensis]MCX4999198.1 ABC transporter ATP-binding protein [Streptomyces longwoodensis]WRY87754.1 ABC transporter ATP-binding protein [Streptomyces longwoodensis]WUC60695.1 ABC transporter ATP-binding protein [Streptomyces longwoodensis]WUC74228.1 ABC transporter ATP-binding protein [Streptomyces longwoodensis]
MTRAISLHDVSKVYAKGARVVDRLTLHIEPGEFLVLLGPSGCGKSTVLRMIAGLEEITEGELLLDGEPANDLLPSARDMAMVFQNFALYPSMSSRDNIGFPLRIEAPGADPGPRVDATARMLGIEDLLDRFPAQLSGGERQRVAMGRAIARHPSAFLMDEPLSNLDAKLRNHLRAEIAHLTRDLGVTTVYVTHDQAEAMSLGHRVAVLRGGVLQQVGSPREVYALPRNIFVAAFIGTPRINLLRGVVRAPLDGAMTISLGKQALRLPEPLSVDHKLLRVQQGREVIVGLRSEAVRIAEPSTARPGETLITGLVEHVEFQGHEALVHFNTGSRPAVVPELEAPRPASRPSRRRRRDGSVLDRLRERAGSLRAGPVVVLDEPPEPDAAPAAADVRLPGDLVVRTTPDLDLRHGMQVPLLVDVAHLFVFDQHGERICPTPARLPDLEE